MIVSDLIPIVSKYPVLYNSVSNYITNKFGIQSAELTLICTYVVYTYIQVILSKQKVLCLWDLEENEIIYVNDILNLFGLNGKDKS